MNTKIWFQPMVTPIMEGIVDLHNHIFGFLILVFGLVLWIFITTLYYFWWLPSYENHGFINHILESRKYLHHTFLETFWTVVPSFILISIGIPSFALLYAMDEVVNPQMTLKIVGHQWYWSYEYSAENWLSETFPEAINLSVLKESSLMPVLNGNKAVLQDFWNFVRVLNTGEGVKSISFDSYMKNEDELELGELRLLATTEPVVLPIQTHIRLLITGADVIHSFAVPSLGIKVDAVPGRQNQAMIFIKAPGIYRGQCSEICGVNHGFMPIEIKAVEGNQFLSWYLAKQRSL